MIWNLNSKLNKEGQSTAWPENRRRIAATSAGFLLSGVIAIGAYNELTSETRSEHDIAAKNVDNLEAISPDFIREQITPELTLLLDDLVELEEPPLDSSVQLQQAITNSDFEKAQPILKDSLIEGDERLEIASDNANNVRRLGGLFIGMTSLFGGVVGYSADKYSQNRKNRPVEQDEGES